MFGKRLGDTSQTERNCASQQHHCRGQKRHIIIPLHLPEAALAPLLGVEVIYLLVLQKIGHGLAHGQADIHIGLGVSAIVSVGRRTHADRIRIDDGGIPLVSIAKGENAVDDELLVAGSRVLVGLSEGGDDKDDGEQR